MSSREQQPTAAAAISNESHTHEAEQDSTEGHKDNNSTEAEEYRELGTHAHGVAELLIALSGNDIAIELRSPAFNILGFEYAPKTDAEFARLDGSITLLEAASFLEFNADADCQLASAEITQTTQDTTLSHSDFDAIYRLDCAQPDRIALLDVSRLFETFTNIERIDVQWVSDTQQSAAQLSPERPVLAFK